MGGAFDCLNWQHSREFNQNFSKESSALGFARGAGGRGSAVLEMTSTLLHLRDNNIFISYIKYTCTSITPSANSKANRGRRCEDSLRLIMIVESTCYCTCYHLRVSHNGNWKKVSLPRSLETMNEPAKYSFRKCSIFCEEHR